MPRKWSHYYYSQTFHLHTLQETAYSSGKEVRYWVGGWAPFVARTPYAQQELKTTHREVTQSRIRDLGSEEVDIWFRINAIDRNVDISTIPFLLMLVKVSNCVSVGCILLHIKHRQLAPVIRWSIFLAVTSTTDSEVDNVHATYITVHNLINSSPKTNEDAIDPLSVRWSRRKPYLFIYLSP